jgi:O-antigen/teichoic acid export membrane protein
MSSARRIAKNTTVLFVSQMITYIIGFFITIYTARYLGVEGFGTLTLALALTGIFVVFTDLGLGTLTVREVARDKSLAYKYVGNTTVMKLILSIITSVLIIITVNIIHYPELVKNVIYIITISMLFNTFSGIFYSILQSFEEMEYQSIAIILNSTIMLVGILLAIYFKLDIIIIALVYIIANAVNFIYIFVIYTYKFHLPKIEVDLNFWKPTIKQALPLSLTSIFAILVFRIDTVILSIIKGELAVGFYNAAYRLMEALIFFPSLYTTAIFPVFSTLYISSKKPLSFAYEKSFKYLTILSLPIAVGITLLANQIIILIFKSAYTPSILTLQIVVWVLPFIFVNYLVGTLLTAINRQNTLLKITMVCLIFNVGLNLVLIPSFSYLGAALVTVLTEALSLAISFYVISQLIIKVKVHRILVKPSIACLIMALFILLVKLNLFVTILIATALYFTVLVGLKTFTPEDYELFKKILNINEE